MTRPNRKHETTMAVQLHLAAETERILQGRAAQNGQTLEAYLESLAAREAQGADGGVGKGSSDLDEFERGLDELAEGLPALPTLPADFSRADIYGEHA
jgi:hypothetical protein